MCQAECFRSSLGHSRLKGEKATATEIAKQGGVSQQSVSKALNGNRVGRVKVVPAICKALELSAKDIVIIED